MVEERWHDFAKEKPSEDMEGRNFIVSNGHYEKIATWCGYWENEPFMGNKLCDEVVRWKCYLTPEEEKANEAPCKELKAIKQGSVELGEYWVYDADDVDALLAKKDAFIKTLGEGQADLAREIERLKQKLEDVQASHYAEMVDAGMRERRLRRALWKERADNASRIECMFRTLSDIEDDDTRTYWIFGNKWESVFYHLKCHRMKTAYDWTMIWENVECKCRAKAEE